MKIVIQPYNPCWLTLFAQEKAKIHNSIGKDGVWIEHISSTSVEGLSAKPVIDILIGLENFSVADQFVSPIEALDYYYVADYEDQMPLSKFFFKEENHKRTHHLHLVEMNSPFWKRHMAFRDYLRENETDRKAYETLKKNLSERDWSTRNDYVKAKSGFIRNIESKLNLNT